MSNVQDNAAHTCSYSCDRPECIKAQRDELAAAAAQEETDEVININGRSGFETHWLAGLAKIGDLLYAAPVTAAPAMLNLANCVQLPLVADETGYRIDPAYAQESTHTAPAAVDPVAAYERELAAGATHEHALHAICTPAAPGIDLTKFLPHTDAVIDKMQEVMAVHRFGVPTRVISDAFRTALLCQQEGLIDASPKSDSCATCNGHGMVGGLLPAGGGYESEPCPHCHGTAGHWEGCPAPDDASPKGGSDAPTYTTGHCENRKKPSGCPLHNLQCGYPQCDRRQAGDAEVQP